MIRKKIIIIAFMLLTIIIPNCCNAETVENKVDSATTSTNTNSSKNNYSKYDYIIDSYNINMVVNENNTFDITETITADFNVSKHGIYRKIPLNNSVTRLDGTTSNNKAQVSNISVNNEYTTYDENGYKVIKIGSKNTTFNGSQTYIIKYTYNIGKDPLKNADELYFNLIGNEWDTVIENVTFQITMPKSFDKSQLGFSSGPKGSTNSSNVNYNVMENVINGKVNNTLKPGEALTIRLTLPEGYFVGAGLELDKLSLLVIAICILFVFITFILWLKYGKDEPVIETVEFYPPEGYNSAEVGFLYEGSASDKSVISLLIYLANKGYLQIEELEEKEEGLSSKSKRFKIRKLKEYDGNNECEEIFFNGLFKGATSSTIDVDKAKEIVEEAELRGEKIAFLEALELSEKPSETRNCVTSIDLHNRFYMTLNSVKSILNSEENKNKIFESNKCKNKWFYLMIAAIFVLITIRPIMEYFRIFGWVMLPIAIFFPGIGFTVLFTMIFEKNGSIINVNGRPWESKLARIMFGLTFGGIFGVMSWYSFVRPCLQENELYLITYFIGIACVAAIIIFKILMKKRTPYGTKMLGKVKGFIRFLETAEKPQLESLVMQNPEYFYDILPYAYALGVSDVWIKQFEFIAQEEPKWYNSHNHFSIDTFGDFMSSTMSSVSNEMISRPESSGSGHSSSSGSSSGGGPQAEVLQAEALEEEAEVLGKSPKKKNH